MSSNSIILLQRCTVQLVSVSEMKVLFVLFALVISSISAHNTPPTFNDLVCQHCNEIHAENRLARNLKYDSTARLSKDFNATLVRQIIREELQRASKLCRNKRPRKTKVKRAASEWTVFQRRTDGIVSFDRDWADYVNGFGNKHAEFWLGLEKLHQLTQSVRYELEINMIERNGTYLTARYRSFHVGSGSGNYRLRVSGYSGNATDSFSKPSASKWSSNRQQFSTRDADHDNSGRNCAGNREGGWWYNGCYAANLNRVFGWMLWYDQERGVKMAMRYTEMKIRPAKGP